MLFADLMTHTEELVTERFCWLTCLDIFQTTCTELLQQASFCALGLLTVASNDPGVNV